MMKIYDRGVGAAGQADVAKAQETARSGRADGSRATGAGQTGGTDTVRLSTATGSLRQALDVHANRRAEKVGALEAAYRSGAYVADSYETSRAMVRDALAGGMA